MAKKPAKPRAEAAPPARSAKPAQSAKPAKPRAREAEPRTLRAEAAAATRAGGAREGLPPFWLFPTGDPNVFIRCDYDPAVGRYNRNCREVRRADLSPRLGSEVTRFTNAVQNHG